MPRIAPLSTLLALALLGACAAPQVAQEPAPEFAGPGLHAVSGSGFEHAYLLPDANLAQYRVIRLDVLETDDTEFRNTTIPGTTRQHWIMSGQRAAALQDNWARAGAAAFADYDLSGRGEQVLRIRAELTRIAGTRSTDSAAMAVGRSTASTRDAVAISVEFRLYDDAGDHLLAVARDRRSIGVAAWTRSGGAELQNLFNSWAHLLHSRVAGR